MFLFLLEKLQEEGITEDEIAQVIKRERRKEEKSLKSDNNTICFKCRQSGHMMSQCPNSGTGANSMPVMGICFKVNFNNECFMIRVISRMLFIFLIKI